MKLIQHQFLLFPFFISFILCSYQQLNYEIDPEYLFSPINGEGKIERAIVEQYFKVNYTSRFNVGRITRPGKFPIFRAFKNFRFTFLLNYSKCH